MPPPPVPTDSPPQSHRIPLTVEMDPLAGDPTPVRCTIDFGSLLSQSDGRRLVDPYTIVVTRDLDGVVARYPVQFDEMLLYGNCGWIAWLVEDPEKGGEWALEFRARGAGGSLLGPVLGPSWGWERSSGTATGSCTRSAFRAWISSPLPSTGTVTG